MMKFWNRWIVSLISHATMITREINQLCILALLLCINFHKFSYMQIPRTPFSFSNWVASKALMNMPTSWFSATTCSRFTILPSTSSHMKWCQMSMWLVQICWTRFFEILIAINLLQYNFRTSCSTFYTFNIYFIQRNWVQLLYATIYSTSTIDIETQLCFLMNQEIKLLPRKKTSTVCAFYIITIFSSVNVTPF